MCGFFYFFILKTHKISVTFKWNDGSEKILSHDDLRYRLGNCSEVNESEDAYQLAIQNVEKVQAFLGLRTALNHLVTNEI